MGRRVLVIDKSLYDRMMLRDILVTHGYSVAEASNVDEAVDIYKRLEPDIVTVDVALPDMDGARAVREIRFVNPNASVLMSGGRGQRRLMMEGMTYGAEGVLMKPFNEKQVLRTLSQSVGRPPQPG